VIRERHRDRRLQAALPPTRFQEVRDGARAERIAFEGARNRRPEFLRAVVVEERE
jgi:hypothetical protein